MLEKKYIEREIPSREPTVSLVDYAAKISKFFNNNNKDITDRSSKGQFFTPKEVSLFMANLITIHSNNIRVLDPGSGTGILTAAFCEKIKALPKRKVILKVDAYEIDSSIIPYLKKVLHECKTDLANHGHKMEFNIYEQDFILSNYVRLEGQMKMSFFENDDSYYDVILSNPPYYKLNKDSAQSSALSDIIYGQPNIYALFIALSTSMLRSNGQMVFITPRSFCSGLYYKRFRSWLLERTELKNIHIFESRKELFSDDDVLQENIIFKSVKRVNKNGDNNDVTISVSNDKLFNDLRRFKANNKHILYRKNGDIFIRIPSSETEVKLLKLIDDLPFTLNDLGIEISTGPVVSFRAKQYLMSNENGGAPLLWMHNLQGWHTSWPLKKNHKELSISVNEQTKKLLLPLKNYVLLKRFSSKEQKRRLYASVLLKSDFQNYEYIGIENHVNYIHRYHFEITDDEAYGIAALLNTSLIDLYFRSLNGNTQVNAVDIRSMPFPSLETIKEIGNIVKQSNPEIGQQLDRIVAEKVNANQDIAKDFHGER